MDIGGALKKVRQHLKLTQAELCRLTGLSQTAVSEFEAGIKHPGKKSIQVIAEALNIPETIIYFLAMEDSDVPDTRKQMYRELYAHAHDLALETLTELRRKTKK